MSQFGPRDTPEALDLPRVEVVVAEVEHSPGLRQQKMCPLLILISSHRMPNSAKRIWSRRPSLDRQLERPHLMQHLQPSQLFRQVGTTSRPPFLTTSRAKLRSDWKVAEIDQEEKNGVEKNRRRISRRSGRAALIMDIVVDIVGEDAAVEDTEVVATAEMGSQAVAVVDIEDVAMRKQPCSNLFLQT